MEFADVIRQRRSVRAYTDEAVGSAAISRLIDTAIQAPSAVNAQPWLFTVVRDRELLDRISTESKRYMLALIDAGTLSQGFREHLSNPEFHIFYHAPALILISAKEKDGWAAENASLAAAYLMLAASAECLGTCWIGFAQRWLETEDGRRAVEIDPEYSPVAPIIVGRPREAAPPVPRKAPTIHWIG
jgi:nitroreductase